jgi:hypothetical protein
MHDNDGFSSLNKDLFTLPHSTRPTSPDVSLVSKYKFDVSSGFIMILFFVTCDIRQKTMKKTVHDSGTWAIVIVAKFLVFLSAIPRFPARTSTTTKSGSIRKEEGKERNLIFVIFDQQEVFLFSSIYFISPISMPHNERRIHIAVFIDAHKTIGITESGRKQSVGRLEWSVRWALMENYFLLFATLCWETNL